MNKDINSPITINTLYLELEQYNVYFELGQREYFRIELDPNKPVFDLDINLDIRNNIQFTEIFGGDKFIDNTYSQFPYIRFKYIGSNFDVFITDLLEFYKNP